MTGERATPTTRRGRINTQPGHRALVVDDFIDVEPDLTPQHQKDKERKPAVSANQSRNRQFLTRPLVERGIELTQGNVPTENGGNPKENSAAKTKESERKNTTNQTGDRGPIGVGQAGS